MRRKSVGTCLLGPLEAQAAIRGLAITATLPVVLVLGLQVHQRGLPQASRGIVLPLCCRLRVTCFLPCVARRLLNSHIVLVMLLITESINHEGQRYRC